MTLAQLREKLKADRAKLADLRSKASADVATAEDRKSYTDALDGCEQTLGLIKNAEREEALEATTTKGADEPVAGMGHNSGDDPRAYAEPKKTIKPEQKALMVMAAAAKSAIILKRDGETVHPYQLLEQEGYGEFVAETKGRVLRDMQKAGVFSNVSSSVLLPKPLTPEIIPILYPESTFLQGDPRRVELIGGQYRQPRGVGSATANYVGEGAKKPVGAPTFDDINMVSHKLAGIVYMTNEAAKWTVGRLEEYIRNDLRTVMGLKMDSAMYFGTGAGATPTGIFVRSTNQFDASAAGNFAAPKAPTVAEIDRIAIRMILSLTAANIAMTAKWRWVMSYRTWAYLSTLRDGIAGLVYPELANKKFKGIDVLVSNQIADNGGTNTDEGTLGLVDFGHVLFAEEEGMVMKTSTEATIDDGGTLVLLWQQNMSAILVEMQHDVTLDQPKAAAVLNKVRWGSTSAAA